VARGWRRSKKRPCRPPSTAARAVSGAAWRSAPAVFAIALLAAGCAAYRPANARLAQWNPDYGYRPRRTYAERPMGDVPLVLAFSGGGTRAAALSYGVLEELRDTRFAVDASERRLLDEVDLGRSPRAEPALLAPSMRVWARHRSSPEPGNATWQAASVPCRPVGPSC